jgi:hypothetical protein
MNGIIYDIVQPGFQGGKDVPGEKHSYRQALV